MISILVEDVERKNNIEMSSFQVENNLTNQADLCDFIVKCENILDWKPTIGDEVVVYDGALKIFGGIVIKKEASIVSNGIVEYRITSKDYSQIMDGKLVFKEYTNKTIQYIITDLVTFMPVGFTANNLATTISGIVITNIIFNYEHPSKCLTTLANLIGCDWYVDAFKVVHFFEKSVGETAPFAITDSNGKYIADTLSIKEEISQTRNVIYVRGGEYAGEVRTDKVGTGDGVTKIFKLPYRYDTTPVVTTVSGTHTVGVDFLDSGVAYNCLWNYQEKVLKFTVPPASGAVEVTGNPMIAVIVKAKQGASVTQFTRDDFNGEYEHVIIDKTIITKEFARLRAQAEMNDYGVSTKSMGFETYESGLQAGQLLNFTSVKLSCDINFIITRVSTKLRTANTFMYSVECSTVREVGIINFLQMQLQDVNRKVGVIKQEGEIMDIIVDIQDIDEVTATDSILGTHLNSEPTWVAGPYYPTSDADRTRSPYTNCGGTVK